MTYACSAVEAMYPSLLPIPPMTTAQEIVAAMLEEGHW